MLDYVILKNTTCAQLSVHVKKNNYNTICPHPWFLHPKELVHTDAVLRNGGSIIYPVYTGPTV